MSFELWVNRIRACKDDYTEKAIKEAIQRSLKGAPANVLMFLGPKFTVDELVARLEKTYGSVATSDIMLAKLYQLEQQPQESVTDYSVRVEGAVSDIRNHHSTKMTREQAEANLKDRFFGG